MCNAQLMEHLSNWPKNCVENILCLKANNDNNHVYSNVWAANKFVFLTIAVPISLTGLKVKFCRRGFLRHAKL